MLISEPELVLVQALDNETDAHLVSSQHAAAMMAKFTSELLRQMLATAALL